MCNLISEQNVSGLDCDMFWCLALMVRWRNMVEVTIVRSDIMKKRWKHSQLSQLSSQPTNFIHWDEDKVSLSTTLTLHQTDTSKKLLQFSRFSNSWEIIQVCQQCSVRMCCLQTQWHLMLNFIHDEWSSGTVTRTLLSCFSDEPHTLGSCWPQATPLIFSVWWWCSALTSHN